MHRTDNARAWVLVAPYALLLTLLMLAPFAATLHKALSTVPSVSFTLLSDPLKALAEPLSAKNFTAIAADSDSRKVVATTVLVAATVATLLCVISMFVGYYIARGRRWQFEEFDMRRLRRLGAGAFVAVAQGSVPEDAAIVHLSWRPKKHAGWRV